MLDNNLKITFLGTGHASCTECYNACFTISNNDEYFLVDCGGGNGILKQLKLANIDIEKIRYIFVSHIHMDHLLGVLWIIRVSLPKFFKGIYTMPITIFGNEQVINTIDILYRIFMPSDFQYLLGYKIILEVVNNNEVKKILNSDVLFFDINAKKVPQFGFCMDIDILQKGGKFTFIGDEPCYKTTEKYVLNSLFLIADAYMCGDEAREKDPIKEHHHSTVEYTSKIGEKLRVKNIFLTHTIDNNIINREKMFFDDSKKYFNGNVIVPDDLEEFYLRDML